MTEIDTLIAIARKRAEKLNRTLDDLEKLGVSATVCRIGIFGTNILPARVQLTLIDNR